MKIYVLHSSNLTKRKKHILEQFRIHNIYNFEFIEKYDITKITDDESIIFDKDYKRTRMSLFLKHLYVYELIAKDNDEEPTLIFEDDVILSDDFNEIVKAYIKETPEDYDMLFIGSGYNLHINKELLDAANATASDAAASDAAHIYKNPYTRATDSYIITNKCAKKLCEYIATANNKITQPIDMWLNKAIIDNQLKIYWSEPTIVSQGSQTGLFELSL